MPKFVSWVAPRTTEGWARVAGQNAKIEESESIEPIVYRRWSYSQSAMVPVKSRVASGCVVLEEGGLVWLVRPAGGFGGYEYTFPKGEIEPGLSPQANAIKEVYEETGLRVRIIDILGDFVGDTSVTRYYIAVREGGTPADADYGETEDVVMVARETLLNFLNRRRDRDIATVLIKRTGGI